MDRQTKANSKEIEEKGRKEGEEGMEGLK